MATLVAMDRDGDVSVRLTISGIVIWHYTYVSRDKTSSGSGTSDHAVPIKLGDPERLDREIDTWRVAAANQAGADVQYSAVLEWIQNEQVIASWRDPDDGTSTVKAGEAVVSEGDAFLVLK